MNDSELDEILNEWNAPTVPASLRESLRAAFVCRYKPSRFTAGWVRGKRKTLWAAAVLAAAVSCMVIAQASPDSISLLVPIPYTLDSEFIHYSDDGLPQVEEYFRSFKHNGVEMILSTSFPGEPVRTALRQILDTTGFLFYQVTWRLRTDRGAGLRRADWIRDGCVWPASITGDRTVVLGHATLLNYRTTVVQSPLTRIGNGRYTEWLAPDLDCLQLKTTSERLLSDGTFRLVGERRTLRVTFTTP